MKRLLLVVVLVGAGVVGLGFYRGWFQIGSDKADGKSNLTLSVDTEKFQEDRKTAVAEVQDLGHQIKDNVAGPSEKTMDGTVVSVNGENLNIAYNSSGNTVAAVAGTYALNGTVSDGTGLLSNYKVTVNPGTFTVNNTGTDADSVVLVGICNYSGTTGIPAVRVNNCVAGTSFDIVVWNLSAGAALNGILKIGFQLL
jgi:hypothetical protein